MSNYDFDSELFDASSNTPIDPSGNTGANTATMTTDDGRTMDTRLPPIKSAGDFFARIKYYFDNYPIHAGIITACRGIVSIIAVMLAWDCNQFESVGLRILVSLLAFIFAEIYILYYAIYHTIFGVTCYTQGYSDLGYDGSSPSSSYTY